MGSSSQNDEKDHVYSAVPLSEFDEEGGIEKNEEEEALRNGDDDDESDEERGEADHKGLGESEGDGEDDDDDDDSSSSSSEDGGGEGRMVNVQQISPLSIAVESMMMRRRAEEYPYYGHGEEINMNNNNSTASTAEMIQDLLGLTILVMLILSPLYRRMGAPTEDPIPPLLTLNSMYVSNFSTENGKLSATWDAKLTVANNNGNVTCMYFRYAEFTIFYRDNPEDAVAVASLYPFYLDEGEAAKVHLKFTTTNDESQPCVEEWLVEEMRKDRVRDDETLRFGMQVNMEAVYYGDTWVSDVDMTPHCEGLDVHFLPNNNHSARLIHPNHNFSVPIGWKPFSLF